jgi:hypothetical protein
MAKYHEISSLNGNSVLNLSPDVQHDVHRCSADYMECETRIHNVEREETTNNTMSLNSDLILLADTRQEKRWHTTICHRIEGRAGVKQFSHT